jgi:hypothetical protein
MAKNEKINIRLEVYKDKNSGKLSIIAHFDSNAPNVAMDCNGYFWIPTFEEKEFINEAYQLIPKYNFDSIKEKIQRNQENLDNKPLINLQKIEKQKESSVFEKKDDYTADKHYEKDSFEKRTDRTDIRSKIYELEQEEPSYNEKDARKKEERVIIEADDAAIDAALKKHWEDEKSFVEVDEQTIIDKVLSQKKKGKWTKKY